MRKAFIMFPRGRLRKSFFAGRLSQVLLVILLITAVWSPSAIAQKHGPILFHGVILDAGTRQPLPDVHYVISGQTAGATDSRGMFSLYARWNDTITFTCIGYSPYKMTVQDTLHAKEYTAGIYLTGDTTVIPAVVVIPRLGNIRAEIMAERPGPTQEMINASNNIRTAVYQGLTNPPELGDPAVNYELLRQKQRLDAYEKGQIPSEHMVGLSPFMLIPLIYSIAAGPPETPDPPAPHISSRDMDYLRHVHDSLLYRH
ncbi:MAG: hypothetical protein KDB91_01320 [Bacteroidales bacterium]|nr:hypothetical protein [Bacteroidales bacterium]MDD3737420.1 hypothetical protein [Bacteroidales bacterium]HOO66844.1 hypothetical protein [Bacteroidales bacterium]HPQ63112.1 hypothetical protein [Bacteroidales bacterium]